jgi:hypothetical protein
MFMSFWIDIESGTGGRQFRPRPLQLFVATRLWKYQLFRSRYSTGAAAKKSVTSASTRVRRIAGRLFQMRRP